MDMQLDESKCQRMCSDRTDQLRDTGMKEHTGARYSGFPDADRQTLIVFLEEEMNETPDIQKKRPRVELRRAVTRLRHRDIRTRYTWK